MDHTAPDLPTAAPLRVLLADDQALLRSAFKVLVDSEHDMEVVGEASDGAQAVELARRTRPDVVLMDIRMPGTDGLAATRMISADPELAAVRVVMLTTFEVDEYVVSALRAAPPASSARAPSPTNCSTPSGSPRPVRPCSPRPPPKGSSPPSSPRAAAPTRPPRWTRPARTRSGSPR